MYKISILQPTCILNDSIAGHDFHHLNTKQENKICLLLPQFSK